jgi:hypothetical protein
MIRQLLIIAGLVVVSWIIAALIFRKRAETETEDWFTFERESAKTWFRTNLFILIAGGLGILGFVIDADKGFGEVDVANASPKYHFSLTSLKSSMHFYQNWFCNMKFHYDPRLGPESEFKAKDDEQRDLCDWFNDTVKKVDALTDENGKDFKFAGFPNSKFYADMISTAQQSYDWFKDSRAELLAAEERAKSSTRLPFLLFAPWLLAVAFGVAIARAWYVP